MSTAVSFPYATTLSSPLGALIQKSWRAMRSVLVSALTPSPARPLNRQEEAQKVRNMALNLMQDDQGFAMDLFAAADRHELGDEA